MKRNATLAFSLLMLTSASYGQNATKPPAPAVKNEELPAKQTVKDQLAALSKEAAPLIAQREANRKALAALAQTKSDIDTAYEALDKGTAKYKVDLASYNIDLGAFTPAAAELNSSLEAHNANRCQKSPSNDCAAYEEEAQRLNSRRDYLQTVTNDLDNRKTIMDGTLSTLRELQSTLQAKSEKYTADAKTFLEQNVANEAKIAPFAAKWKSALESMGDCFKKLPAGATDEQIHESCGAAWDGNKIAKKPPVNQTTGGATATKQ